jgi:hypothetical protein
VIFSGNFDFGIKKSLSTSSDEDAPGFPTGTLVALSDPGSRPAVLQAEKAMANAIAPKKTV